MTEAELVEASVMYNGAMQGWISLYFTAFTAYVTAAYFIGSKLDKNQVLFISGGFIILSTLCTISAYGTGAKLVYFAEAATAVNANLVFAAKYQYVYAATVMLSIGILGSLKFMWDVRHPKAE